MWIGSSAGLFIFNLANFELEAVLHFKGKTDIQVTLVVSSAIWGNSFSAGSLAFEFEDETLWSLGSQALTWVTAWPRMDAAVPSHPGPCPLSPCASPPSVLWGLGQGHIEDSVRVPTAALAVPGRPHARQVELVVPSPLLLSSGSVTLYAELSCGDSDWHLPACSALSRGPGCFGMEPRWCLTSCGSHTSLVTCVPVTLLASPNPCWPQHRCLPPLPAVCPFRPSPVSPGPGSALSPAAVLPGISQPCRVFAFGGSPPPQPLSCPEAGPVRSSSGPRPQLGHAQRAPGRRPLVPTRTPTPSCLFSWLEFRVREPQHSSCRIVCDDEQTLRS